MTSPVPAQVAADRAEALATLRAGCGQCVTHPRARGLCSRHYQQAQARKLVGDGIGAISIKDRFWSKVLKSDGCWEWQAARLSAGYGSFSVDGVRHPAHRIAWQLVVGPIAPGLHIDHLCRNIICVNPAHLEPVTPRENTHRGVGPSAQNARKTSCNQGHPFDEANTYVSGDGKRACRQCRSANTRRHRARRSAAVVAGGAQ